MKKYKISVSARKMEQEVDITPVFAILKGVLHIRFSIVFSWLVWYVIINVKKNTI